MRQARRLVRPTPLWSSFLLCFLSGPALPAAAKPAATAEVLQAACVRVKPSMRNENGEVVLVGTRALSPTGGSPALMSEFLRLRALLETPPETAEILDECFKDLLQRSDAKHHLPMFSCGSDTVRTAEPWYYGYPDCSKRQDEGEMRRPCAYSLALSQPGFCMGGRRALVWVMQAEEWRAQGGQDDVELGKDSVENGQGDCGIPDRLSSYLVVLRASDRQWVVDRVVSLAPPGS